MYDGVQYDNYFHPLKSLNVSLFDMYMENGIIKLQNEYQSTSVDTQNNLKTVYPQLWYKNANTVHPDCNLDRQQIGAIVPKMNEDWSTISRRNL